ncbi:hypothetical protein BDR07DRAFT_1478712 [Suillus spraguei]|nr:hypothetical protein BDR07DRAFT_1478712 [Suillus spraguei]
MHPSTLYKGYQAQLAAHETARQHMLATVWEIEEAEHFIVFLNAMHTNNEDWLKFMDDQLHSLRSLFSEFYEDEHEILKAISSQAEHVVKVLGLRVSKVFQSGVGASRFPSSQPGVIDDEDNNVGRVSVKSRADDPDPPPAVGFLIMKTTPNM